ncbi:MAG: hypothetical protein JWP88_86 [Flaviaesturariibacter sp.]|nr:hypothetical protein [Flaviaesturariibacter sp.]
MKKYILFLVILIISIGNLFAGDGPRPEKQAWKKSFPGKIEWYKVTDAGIVIVCTKDALYGIDPLTGAEKWKKEDLNKIVEENYDPIEASPLIAIVDRGMIPRHVIIDVYSGQTLVDTKEAGLYAVQKRFADPDLKGIFFFGTSKTGKPVMMLIDAATGAKRWEVEKIFEKNSEQIVAAPYSVSADAFMIATTKGIYKISKASGEVLWNTDMKNEVPELKPEPAQTSKVPFAGFGKAFKGMNKAQGAMATATNARFFQLEKYPATVYFYTQDHFTAFSIADGKEVWDRIKLKSPVTDIIYDSHGLLVATAENDDDEKKKKSLIGKLADKNKARLMCLDYSTGKELWKEALSIAGDVVYYKYADMNTLCLATANEKGKNRIDVVNLGDGSTKTKNPIKVDGDILDIRMVPQGLLYRTTDEMNILNLETAKDAWSKSIKFKNGNLGIDKDATTTYIFGNGKIIAFDNTKGDYTEFFTGVDFDGGERPSDCALTENGLLFTSSQNMLLVGLDGKKVYQVYKKAPGISTAGKVFFAALAVVATAQNAQHSFNSGYARGKGAYSTAENEERKADSWGNIATASFQEMNKRFKRTVESMNYMSILTKTADSDDSGVGIVLMNKLTGKEEGSVVLKDKKPDYQLDDITRMVFYKNSNDELTGYSF